MREGKWEVLKRRLEPSPAFLLEGGIGGRQD
jgi:hypothetical protein